MIPNLAFLLTASFVISLFATAIMRRIAPRIGFVDKPGHRKIHSNPKPLLGGVGIYLGIVLPMLLGFVLFSLITYVPHQPASESAVALQRGAEQQSPLMIGLLIALTIMHILGLLDDRRALGPFFKLIVQLGVIAALVIAMELLAAHTPSLRLRVLTFLDKSLGLGPWPSIILTVLYIGVVTNAFNFLDNMDGLSAGVGAVCTTAFLVTTISIEQWFVAAALAMLLGSLLGFLVWNFPPAKIFMGDSGSLLIGLLLGVLTVRTTFLPEHADFHTAWYATLAPVIVLAVPLYDLCVVSAIRLSRGKSPFVGDTNHLSHRLVARGMSKRTAVLCIWLITAATAMAAILLPQVRSAFGAILIGLQTVLVLGVVALLEQHPTRAVETPIGTPAAPAPAPPAAE